MGTGTGGEAVGWVEGRVGAGSAPPAARFPRLGARNLHGRTFLLPDDLEGERNLVLVGFEERHQPVMDAWLPAVEPLLARRPDLRLYELVPIPRARVAARQVIDGGMARGIADPAIRERTLTAYADLRPLLVALNLPGTRESAVFLVDRGGGIAWGARGGPDAAGVAALRRALGEAH